MRKLRTRIWISVILVGLALLTDGCFGLIDADDHNRGLIVSEYPINNPPKTQLCYEPGLMSSLADSIAKNNIIINSDISLKAYFDNRRYNNLNRYGPGFPCVNFQPESVDFSTYTLLGNYAQGGCDVAFTRSVIRDDNSKKYSYTVTVREAGSCKKLGFSMNWVLVPKLPPGYAVDFRIK